MSEEISIEYTALDEIERWPRNPKEHDLEQIKASLRRHGYVDPIVRDATSGKIVAGHGRSEALTEMWEAKEPPPKRVKVLDDGRWAVPVLGGVSWDSESEAEAFLVTSNRLVELGGWDNKMLAEMLGDMRSTEQGLIGVGFTDSEIRSLLSQTDEERTTGKTPEEKLEGFLAGDVKQMVFYFEDAEYGEVLEQIESIMAGHEELETHTDAFLHILEFYKEHHADVGDETPASDDAA